LDFLDKYEPAKSWLQVSLVRNPFILSCTLDERLSTPRFSYEKDAEKRLAVVDQSRSQFVTIGGGAVVPG
jgi:hypothetical protein